MTVDLPKQLLITSVHFRGVGILMCKIPIFGSLFAIILVSLPHVHYKCIFEGVNRNCLFRDRAAGDWK